MGRRSNHIGRSDEHNARGIELADRGWLDEATSEFRKAIELDPQSAHAHDNLGTVLAEKGDLLAALTEYLEALKVDPESPTAHLYLASFLAGQPMTVEAVGISLARDEDREEGPFPAWEVRIEVGPPDGPITVVGIWTLQEGIEHHLIEFPSVATTHVRLVVPELQRSMLIAELRVYASPGTTHAVDDAMIDLGLAVWNVSTIYPVITLDEAVGGLT